MRHKSKRDPFEMSRSNAIAMGAVGGVAGIVMYKLHAAQKWDAALVGTLSIFWYLTWLFRSKWTQVWFWGAFVLCVLIHLALVFWIFAILMSPDTKVGLWTWIPVDMIEGLGFYYLVALVGRSISSGDSKSRETTS